MGFLVRSALIGGTGWMAWKVVMFFFGWLIIPIIMMLGFNQWYEDASGAGAVIAAEKAAYLAQRDLVSVGNATYLPSEIAPSDVGSARITVYNRSEGDASNFSFTCRYMDKGAGYDSRSGRHFDAVNSMTLRTKAVVPAGETITFTLDTPYSHAKPGPATGCTPNFDFAWTSN